MTSRETAAVARRGQVIDTARGLFVANGFHSTGMAQIAAASGVRVGQIYRDFASKEDIIAAICEIDLARWLEEDTLADAVAKDDPQALRRWIGRFVAIDEPIDECRMMTEIVAEAGRNVRIAEINRAIDARVRTALDRALCALVPARRDTDARGRLIELILALGAGLTMRRIINPAADFAALNASAAAWIGGELDALIGRRELMPA